MRKKEENLKIKKLTSLHAMLVPKTTLRPSKKLSPIIMTVDPPVVHPSLGLRAFIHGVASGNGGYNPTANNFRVNITGRYL